MPNKKTIISIALALVIGVIAGLYLSPVGQSTDTAQNEEPQEREIAYWVGPMDPSYRRDGPGKSPMGMDLIPVYVGEEAEDSVGDSRNGKQSRFEQSKGKHGTREVAVGRADKGRADIN